MWYTICGYMRRETSPVTLKHEGTLEMRINPIIRAGRISYATAAMLLGLPLPIVILALFCGGCTKW